MVPRHSPDAERRDRALGRVRALSWATAAAAAGLTVGLSVAAAHAFKGHDGKVAVAARAQPPASAARHVSVPRPQHIPAVAGLPSDPQPLQPPAAPPQAAVPDQQPQVQSGGS